MQANIPAFLGVAAFILITPGPDTALVTKNALIVLGLRLATESR